MNEYQRALWCIAHWRDDWDEETASEMRAFARATSEQPIEAAAELIALTERVCQMSEQLVGKFYRSFEEQRNDPSFREYNEATQALRDALHPWGYK